MYERLYETDRQTSHSVTSGVDWIILLIQATHTAEWDGMERRARCDVLSCVIQDQFTTAVAESEARIEAERRCF